MSVATIVMVPLFALVILYSTLAVARLVRSLREVESGPAFVDDPERLALEDEKQRLLSTLRDLDHEHSLGKLSDADHDGLKRHFERETVRILDRLEALERSRAQEQGAQGGQSKAGA